MKTGNDLPENFGKDALSLGLKNLMECSACKAKNVELEQLRKLLASARRYVEYGADKGMSLGARYAQDLLTEIDALT